MKQLFCLVLLFTVTSPLAYCAYLSANDEMGTSSFNAAGHWDDGLPPYLGEWYYTQGYMLRTPSVAGSYAFGGDCLVVGGGDGGGLNPFLTDGQTNSNCLINKTPGNPVITVPYLLLNQGYIRDGMGSADSWTLDGTLEVSPNGGGLACQSRFDINSQINGYGTLFIADNGNGDAARTIYIHNPYNTYSGNIYLLGSSPDFCRLTFSEGSMMNFEIGPYGTTNSIWGMGTVTCNGIFRFNLWNAGTNPGDTWIITNAGIQTFGPSFSVADFTPMGNGAWRSYFNGRIYSFDQNTGVLTCLEAPTLTVLTPNGNEHYVAGRPVEIQYTSAGVPPTSTVSILFSTDGGYTYNWVASGAPSTGSIEWITPEVESLYCYIQIYSEDNWQFNDTSDSPFIIYHCPESNPVDLNGDCHVDLKDLAVLAQNWLWCRDPYNPACFN